MCSAAVTTALKDLLRALSLPPRVYDLDEIGEWFMKTVEPQINLAKNTLANEEKTTLAQEGKPENIWICRCCGKAK